MTNKIRIMRDIWIDSQQKMNKKLKRINEIFPKNFQIAFNHFMLGCQKIKIDDVAKCDNHDFLFKTYDLTVDINPIFKFLDGETQAENQRWGNSTFAAYLFSDIDVVNFPVRIDITNKKISSIPDCLRGVIKNNSKLKAMIDIEFFERISLDFDSKNQGMKSLISDYLKDGNLSEEELKEIGNPMSLEDVEKIHTKFLIFEDDSIVVSYIGIGTNQPYGIATKSKTSSHGKNRFYKYDLENLYEQESSIKFGKDINFGNDVIFEDKTCDGTRFAIHNSEGVAIFNGKRWVKAILEQPLKDLDLNNEISNNNGVDFLKSKLEKTYLCFDKYAQVSYDPIEIINSFGHEKTAIHLHKNELLGKGYQIPINVASDLYRNGYVNLSGLKACLLLMCHMINRGDFEKLILNTVKKSKTTPYKNL